MKKYSNILEKKFKLYEKQVEIIANEVFEKKVLPWLKRNKCRRFVGEVMGVTIIFDANNKVLHDLPKKIEEVISIEIPGNNHAWLGMYMPDWENN